MKPPAISAIQEIELNIAPGTEIDPWPRYGLAAKYKPFILNRVKPFLQNNGHLNRNEVITDAIRITWEASQKFKQEGCPAPLHPSLIFRFRRGRIAGLAANAVAGMVLGWSSTPAF